MRVDTDALKAIYQTVPEFATKTFTSIAKRDPATGELPDLPYVVFHPADGRDTQERVTGPKITRHPRYTVHIFGEDGDQCQALADLVKPKLVVNGIGVTLTVTGWRNSSLWYEAPIPIQVDWEGPEPVAFHVAEIGWTSDPA